MDELLDYLADALENMEEVEKVEASEEGLLVTFEGVTYLLKSRET